MTTPRDHDGPSGRPSGLPPHLDPRGARRVDALRVTRADRTSAGSVPPAAEGAPQRVAPARRSRGQRVGRVLSWVALTMSIVVLGIAGVGYALLQHYDSNIQRIPVFNDAMKGSRGVAAPRNAQNILLVGSDSRAGANGVGTGGLTVSGQRSDTMILAHLYGTSNDVELVSLPRDSYVEIPAYTDPTTGRTRPLHHDKINSSFAEGGPPLLIATVENLTNIKIDHYVQVDFSGFKSMVDKLGGVDVCLKKAAIEANSNINLSAGRHHIDGNVALSFVRQRYGLARGDLDRIGRQQQLLGSMVHKVLSAGTLLDPFKLNGFLNVATSSLKVDEKLSAGNLRDLALRLRNFQSKSVLFTTVPVADIGLNVPGVGSVVQIDQVAAARLFDALRADQAPNKPAPKAPLASANPLTVPASAIRVQVFNGSGVAGLGRRAFADLTSVGFATVGTPSNRGTGAGQTVITYGSSRADSAKTLAAALPGSVLRMDPTLSGTLEVVIGSGYTTARPVVVGPSTSATPGTTPTPVIRTASEDPCSGA